MPHSCYAFAELRRQEQVYPHHQFGNSNVAVACPQVFRYHFQVCGRLAPDAPTTFGELPYHLVAFTSSDEFQVIGLGGSFDCISGMPYLARHRADIDWLNCTAWPRLINVNAVITVLNSAASI